jgi:DNA-binding transcriptional LysR family regulator
MTNIPTELLRTLIAVVDHKSFTKAAYALGVTQPAVSAQIKRLQALLGSEIFDKNIAAVALTPAGETVVTYARRMMSINDQILQLAAAPQVRRPLRIGINGDYFSPYLPRALANFRKRWPYRRFEVVSGAHEQLLQDLRSGAVDLTLLLAPSKPEPDARYHWLEEMVWARGAATSEVFTEPVQLCTRGERWLNHQVGVATLEKAGLRYEVSFSGPTILTLISAVRSGFGVMPGIKRRIISTDLVICGDQALPKMPEMVCSLCVSELGDSDMLNEMAEEISTTIQATTLAPESAPAGIMQLKRLADS